MRMIALLGSLLLSGCLAGQTVTSVPVTVRELDGADVGSTMSWVDTAPLFASGEPAEHRTSLGAADTSVQVAATVIGFRTPEALSEFKKGLGLSAFGTRDARGFCRSGERRR